MTNENVTHTPGPWHVIQAYEIAGPNGEDIGYANASDGADDPVVYPGVANARLMAAAPDLLAACQGLVSALSLDLDDHQAAAWDAARAAIAKAEGSSR